MSPPRVMTVLAATAALAVAQFDPPTALNRAYFAAAAYCDAASVASWTCKPCQVAADVASVTVVSDAKLDVHGYVALLRDGSVVVGFRGTNPLSLQDWIDDLDAFPTKGPYPGCAGCEVHSGFYDAWMALSSQVLNALVAYNAKSAPAVHVTGHSLGGAIGTLATYELLLAGYPVVTHLDFGRPRVGDPAYAAAFYQVVALHNFSAAALHTDAASLPWSAVLTDAAHAAHAADAARLGEVVMTAVKAAAAVEGAGAVSPARTRAAHHGRMAHRVRSALGAYVQQLRFDHLSSLPTMPNTTLTQRVTHYADPVPHLPLEVMGFAHDPQEIWYNDAQTSYRVCSAVNGEDQSCSDSLLLDLDILDHLNYMTLEIALLC